MVRRAVKSRAKVTTKFLLKTLLVFFILGLVIFVSLKLIYFFYDNDGTQISGNIVAPLGTKTSISKIEKKLQEKNLIYDSIKEASDSSDIIVELQDGPKVLFTQNQDLRWQIDSVILILQHLTVNDRKPKLIDLTSSRPIVKF